VLFIKYSILNTQFLGCQNIINADAKVSLLWCQWYIERVFSSVWYLLTMRLYDLSPFLPYFSHFCCNSDVHVPDFQIYFYSVYLCFDCLSLFLFPVMLQFNTLVGYLLTSIRFTCPNYLSEILAGSRSSFCRLHHSSVTLSYHHRCLGHVLSHLTSVMMP